MSVGARTGRATSLLDRMTRWGQMYDQEVNAYRRLGERYGDDYIPTDDQRDHALDMESLADGAANILSSLHVALDKFLATTDSDAGEDTLSLAVTELQQALEVR